MTRKQLEHIVRAAAANADTDEIVVVGSQALLGSVPQPRQEVLVILLRLLPLEQQSLRRRDMNVPQ